MNRYLAASLAAALAALPISASAAAACADLGAMARPDTTLDAAQAVGAGSYTPAGGAAIGGLPAFCRLHGTIAPVSGSQIGFELWLPQAGWNGKFLMVGNGGYSSAIAYPAMAAQLRAGYAVAGTDTGHQGDDPDFAVGHPEAIVDWGYRAVHATAVAAKGFVAGFFGVAPRYAYFAGCSTGGHQAFMEAQRYPEDFDGIVAGDPGHNRTHLNAAFLWQYLRNHRSGDDAGQVIPASKLGMITRAVLERCRADNGQRSGGLPSDDFLDDPEDCAFEPAALQCPGADGPDCLTSPQVASLRAMYAGATNPRTGERIAFGFPKGSEDSGRVLPSLPGWSLYWADPKDASRPARVNFWREWAFGSDWSWWSFDADRDMAAVDAKLAPTINAMSPDLDRFRARGGKMIHYHGLADPVVPPMDSISYYERVIQRLQDGGAGADQARLDVASFDRLFLVPGMEHCQGGRGPDSFDAVTALDRWVDQQVPPDRIVATRFEGVGADRKAAFTRPLCPYPQQARYRGQGNPTDAAQFDCRADGQKRDLPQLGRDYLR